MSFVTIILRILCFWHNSARSTSVLLHRLVIEKEIDFFWIIELRFNHYYNEVASLLAESQESLKYIQT